MVFNDVNKHTMWLISVKSKRNFSIIDRDFIAELVSEEARKVIESYSFVLHDIIESKKCCKILIEGTKIALINLLLVIRNNFSYKVFYTKYNK